MPKIVIPLTDSKIKTIKADSTKVQKLADGNGLFLIISKTGDKSWRFDYSRPYTKKRNSLSFGSYPTVTLADARIRREEARTLLSQNIDPHVEKVRIENEILNTNNNTFQNISNEWMAKQDFAESTIKGQQRLLEVINQHIGKIPVHEIKAMDILKVCRIYEKEGKLETAVIDSRVESVEGVRLKRVVPDIYQSNIATELNATVTWVDTGNAEHFTLEKGSSIYNPHEIDQIIDFLKRVDQDKSLLQRLMPSLNSIKEPAIGVICTYAEQKNRLRKAFALSDVSNELRSIVRIDTVDSYQGKENQIIILSVTRNDSSMFPAFLQSPNRVNVALSRAMDRLVIFGAEEMWQGVNKRDLLMPLDVHTFSVSKKLGLISHPRYDFKAVLELTQKLKEFDINDPVKYDFALYRIGQEKLVI